MDEPLIVKIGKNRFLEDKYLYDEKIKQKKKLVRLAKEKEPDELLNDIENTPHAYVLACLMDRQITAERAWVIPYRVYQELKTTDIHEWALKSESWYVDFFKKKQLHRYNNNSAIIFHLAIHDIITKYDGDAAQIWSGVPSSASVVYRFLEFHGCGIKIATMAANILTRQFMVPFSDCYSIDISPDVHIRRVMKRMGYVNEDANNEMIIYKARELNPEFPGVIDFPCWEIGKEYCRPTNPQCIECIVNSECKSAFLL